MDDFLKTVSDYIQQHWLKAVTAAVFLGIGWLFGKYRARQQWEKKEFLDRLNISLNTIADGKLLIRTLAEMPCEEVFLNSVAVKRLLAAAGKTTEADPIVPFAKDDYWYYLNSVLNEISEQFALGLLKRDMGVDVRKETYVLCITNECAGDLRTRKIRAMVIKKSLLTGLPEKPPAFESPNHHTRWKTLGQLAAAYEKDRFRFLEMEICV